MTLTLKPCPFCGSNNVDFFRAFGDPSTDENCLFVACIDCGAQTQFKAPLRDNNGNIISHADVLAADVWNRRDNTNPVNADMFAVISDLANAPNCRNCNERKARARNIIDNLRRRNE